MHCVKCGRALAQEAKFCGVCGQPVVGERPAQPSKQPSGRTSQAGCAVAVLGLVLALAFCTGSDEAGEPASNEARVVDLKACEAVLTAARSPNSSRISRPRPGSMSRMRFGHVSRRRRN